MNVILQGQCGSYTVRIEDSQNPFASFLSISKERDQVLLISRDQAPDANTFRVLQMFHINEYHSVQVNAKDSSLGFHFFLSLLSI